MTLFDHIKSLFENSEKFFSDGSILKNKLVESALNLDPELLKILLADERAKKTFFQEVEDLLVFDKIKFQKFVSNKEFLPDSFTAFKNKIGLTANGEYLTEAKEVVLDFPYKDCVLEGGQTKEDQKRQEIFWNETLAPDEIDRLFEPKVFTNWKRFDKDGEHEVDAVSINDNFVIKGNNLIALHSISKVYKGKIKLIYIDPPYNTGSDGFQYNDSFNHSAWLTFMKNRLEIARELLTEDGSIWINIDDNESHYLKVLVDGIFGRENFLINFIWQKKYSPSNDAKYFSDNHDHILVYAKNKNLFSSNLLPRTDEMNARYKNLDNDPRGDWKPGGFSVKTYSKEYDYPIETPSGKIVYPPEGSCWQTSKENYLKKLEDNRIWFGANGDSKPQLKQFLSEVQQGMVAKSIWLYDEVGHNQISRSEIIQYLGKFEFSTPKPEKLLHRIISLASNENDIVLDFFAGSGTTPAVSTKMKRRFIAIEQMEYVNTVTIPRLQKVLEGAQIGVSSETNWKGGGSFVFCELENVIDDRFFSIIKEGSREKIMELLLKLLSNPALQYKLDEQQITTLLTSSSELEIDDFKKLAISLFDKNSFYLPFSEIGDKEWSIKEADRKLNNSFYAI